MLTFYDLKKIQALLQTVAGICVLLQELQSAAQKAFAYANSRGGRWRMRANLCHRGQVASVLERLVVSLSL